MKVPLLAFLLWACYAAHPGSQVEAHANYPGLFSNSYTQQGRLATLRGRVLDARTGEPIGKARVIVNGSNRETITDDAGAFTIENLPPGPAELYITTITYGLVKKTITVREGEDQTITIGLNEDAAALTEQVIVSLGPYETTQTSGVAEQTINKRELQTISSILVGDPLRAAQALPGNATNDDFRSEFSLRGARFDRVGLYVDGILTDNFVHTIAGGYLDTGSLSVINADTVDSVSLMSGAFGAKFGDRTAGILNIETREGNRVKPTGRVAAALSGISGTIDGPFANKQGSYLFAARKSYIGYLIRRLNDENHFTNNPPILNFADFQTKVSYDATRRTQIGGSIIYGDLDFDRNRDRELLFVNSVFRGTSRNLLVNTHWNFTPGSRLFLQIRLFGLRTSFHNINRDELVLNDGTRSQFGGRSDLSFQVRASNRLETGVYMRSLHVDSLSRRFGFLNVPFDFGTFDRRGTEQAYYVQDTWNNEHLRLVAVGGARLEYSSLTHQTTVSPRASIVWSPSNNWKFRGSAGRYDQFPDFERMFGRLGNPNLTAERSTQVNGSVERLLGNRTRVMAEVYDREDSDLHFSLSEPRLVNDKVSFAELPFRNSLKGHARGIELTLQRRSANKLTGWISYAYSRTRLKDVHDGLVFVSDTDQRHTLNVFGSYRFNDRWNMSGQSRYGSGPPVPGFFRRVGQTFFLSNDRNNIRVPHYSRVDVRVSRVFILNQLKLTLNGEVLNLLNRNNVRYEGFDGFGSDGRVFGQLNRVLPILPSAGVVLEF